MTSRRANKGAASETCAMLLRALRHASEQRAISADDVIDLARVQLSRPGAPGYRLGVEDKQRLEEALRALGRQLEGAPSPRKLYAFAQAAAEAAHALARPERHPGQRIGEKVDRVRALAEAAVWAEATRARDSEDLVRRAVVRAVRERKKGRGLVRVDVDDRDPLRTLLDLPHKGRVLLPRNDVRARIAQAAGPNAFGDALRKAARFSEELIRPLIGDELWELGRPVGFADRDETRVLVEVTSSVRAHEVKLRSLELLDCLARAPGFERARGVEIVLRAPSALPVVGRGRRPAKLREQ